MMNNNEKDCLYETVFFILIYFIFNNKDKDTLPHKGKAGMGDMDNTV